MRTYKVAVLAVLVLCLTGFGCGDSSETRGENARLPFLQVEAQFWRTTHAAAARGVDGEEELIYYAFRARELRAAGALAFAIEIAPALSEINNGDVIAALGRNNQKSVRLLAKLSRDSEESREHDLKHLLKNPDFSSDPKELNKLLSEGQKSFEKDFIGVIKRDLEKAKQVLSSANEEGMKKAIERYKKMKK